MRALFVCALALGAAGCFKLDPFLYSRERTTAYDFNPEGRDPGSTVTADRITPVTIVESDQISLGAVFVTAASPKLGYALFFHGNGPNLNKQFERVKRVANLGYDTLGIDYRGWGMSTDVTPTEAGVEEDSRAALKWMTDNHPDSEGRLIYYGHSFGTAVATQRAVIDPPAVLVLESAFASIEEFKTDSSGMDFPYQYVADDSWPTSTRIRDVHRPVLILHGLDDTYVRPEFSQLLYDHANDPKKLVLVEGATHDGVAPVLGDQYPVVVNGFVEPYLQ